ncbi:unnamed protein product [Arctogadus glacialis]
MCMASVQRPQLLSRVNKEKMELQQEREKKRAESPATDQTVASRSASGPPSRSSPLSADPSLPEQEALLIRADSYRSISSSRVSQALACGRLHRKETGQAYLRGLCGDRLIGDALMSL